MGEIMSDYTLWGWREMEMTGCAYIILKRSGIPFKFVDVVEKNIDTANYTLPVLETPDGKLYSGFKEIKKYLGELNEYNEKIN